MASHDVDQVLAMHMTAPQIQVADAPLSRTVALVVVACAFPENAVACAFGRCLTSTRMALSIASHYLPDIPGPASCRAARIGT
jgi:hypothetical protein